MQRPLLGILFVCLYSQLSLAANTMKQTVSDQEMLKHGQEIYMNRCMGCHGEKGDGKGPGAAWLNPRPRDFTAGIFKFRSTPLGALPTDDDLLRTLNQGLLGTSMPNFRLLSLASKTAVIQYIKSFSETWDDKDNYQAAIGWATFPLEDFGDHGKFIARAKKGRGLYVENCATCHGPKGLGDGEGGQDLEDEWGFPIQPGNLTNSYIKTGRSVKSIYRVVLGGIGGTPMPSFYETISNEDIWNVAAYVLYIRGLSNDVYGDSTPIKPISPEELE